MKTSFIDKILDRLDNLSNQQVEALVDKLVREKGLLEQVFEALQEGVIIFNDQGTVLFINKAALNLFGLQDQQPLGKSLNELLPGLGWESFSPDQSSVVSRDLEILYPDHRMLNVYSTPIIGEHQHEHFGRVLLVRDITSQLRETEQSIESEKFNALTLLAAGVAHEIGNPLNSLGIQLQLLGRKLGKLDTPEHDSLSAHLEKAQNEISRLDTILQDFLHAIRPTAPKRSMQDIHQLITDTISQMENELAARHTKVRLQFDDDLPQLSLDPGQIKQAFYNLLNNASQAMSAEGGEVLITTKVNEYEVFVQIQDQGSGISPEIMGQLYEPFQSTKKEEGTGLGLLIVRRIIREHGGELKIESEVGTGTCISLFFPREDQRIKFIAETPSKEDLIDLESNSPA